MATLAITGASGCFGQSLLRQTVPRHQVRALFRAPSQDSEYWQERGATIVLGDLESDSALARLTEGADAVFHLAATMDKSDPSQSRRINVEGTRRLLERLASPKIVFIYVSSISVYAATRLAFIDETIEPRHTAQLNPYSATKLEGERLVRAHGDRHRSPYLIFRPTNVYGPYSVPWLKKPIQLAESRLPWAVGGACIDMIHVDDVCRALLAALETPTAHGETYILSHQMYPLRDYVAEIGHVLGRRLRKLPDFLDTLVCRGVDMGYYLSQGHRSSLSLSQPVQYSSHKAREAFGFAPSIRLPDGLWSCMQWHFSRLHQEKRKQRVFHLVRPKHFESVRELSIHDEAGVVSAMRQAERDGLCLRACGVRASKNRNFETPGIALRLNSFNGVLGASLDTIRVQAGMSLSQLAAHLNAMDRALPNVGEWMGQSVAGAVSTGTHGGSLQHGTLASSVRSFRMVAGNGEIVEARRGEESFNHLVLSFGLCGVLSELEFETVPRYRLALSKQCETLSEFLHTVEQKNRATSHFSSIWIPAVDRVITYGATPTEAGPTPEPREVRFGAKNLLGSWFANQFRSEAWLGTAGESHSVVGNWDEILAPINESSRFFKWLRGYFPLPLEYEVALPVHQTERALRELQKLFEKQGRYPSLPFGLRFGKAEPFSLSPAYNQNVFWLSFFGEKDGSLLPQLFPLLADLEARYHWGKNMPPGYRVGEGQFEKLPQVLALRAQLDPRGLCSNSFTQSLGL